MPFFIITMTHPDDTTWRQSIDAHLDYLLALRDHGILRASGGLVDAPVKTGFIILTAPDRRGVEQIVADDPHTHSGAVGQLQISEWDPFIGIFAAESSGTIPSGAG